MLKNNARRVTVVLKLYHCQGLCYTLTEMSDCTGRLHPRAREGLRLFNEGKYFEAHEALEAAWREEGGALRGLYQGILEAAVTYLHITRGNYAGAVKVYARSMRWLTRYPEVCRGVNVARLREDLTRAIREVENLGEAQLIEFDRALLKPIVWEEG